MGRGSHGMGNLCQQPQLSSILPSPICQELPDGHLSPGTILLPAGVVGLGQQFSSPVFHVSSVTRMSPGATPDPSTWAPSPGLGAALFQARSLSSLLEPGFMLLPSACQTLQEEDLSPQQWHPTHLSPLGLKGHHMWGEQILIPLCQWLVVSIGDQVVQNSTCTPESSKLPAAPGLCLTRDAQLRGGSPSRRGAARVLLKSHVLLLNEPAWVALQACAQGVSKHPSSHGLRVKTCCRDRSCSAHPVPKGREGGAAGAWMGVNKSRRVKTSVGKRALPMPPRLPQGPHPPRL